MENFDPNSNYLFTEEEFNAAKSRDLLPLRCLACGKIFYKRKHEIQGQKKRSISANRFCSNRCVGIGQRAKTVVCKCSQCGKEIERTIKSLPASGNVFCSLKCSALYTNAHRTTGFNRSKLEKFLEQELPKIFPDLEIRYNDRELCNGLELDLYIPSLKIAFELNGPVHYQPFYGKTLEEKEKQFDNIRTKDIMKQHICSEKRIDLYIIDVSRYQHNTLKKNIEYLHYVEQCIKENM